MVAGYWERGDVEGACVALVAEAVGRWRKAALPGEEVVDDITVILAFLWIQ